MKYRLELEIDCPREKVAALYADPENWREWQQGLVSWSMISGEARNDGAKTRLVNRFGRRDVEIVEKVESNRLPETLICTYEAEGAWNRVVSRFSETDAGTTLWEFETEFRCRGLLRLAGLLMPGMFRKASMKEMQAFRRFAESRN